jgi:hypothetical protein
VRRQKDERDHKKKKMFCVKEMMEQVELLNLVTRDVAKNYMSKILI